MQCRMRASVDRTDCGRTERGRGSWVGYVLHKNTTPETKRGVPHTPRYGSMPVFSRIESSYRPDRGKTRELRPLIFLDSEALISGFVPYSHHLISHYVPSSHNEDRIRKTVSYRTATVKYGGGVRGAPSKKEPLFDTRDLAA